MPLQTTARIKSRFSQVCSISVCTITGWLGSRVSACWTKVQKAWVQIAVATLSGNSFRHTADTHCASVHQAAKLVAALLRVAAVTASLAESSNSTIGFMTHVTCSLTAKNWDQLRNHTLGNRVWATFTFFTIKCLYKSHSN